MEPLSGSVGRKGFEGYGNPPPARLASHWRFVRLRDASGRPGPPDTMSDGEKLVGCSFPIDLRMHRALSQAMPSSTITASNVKRSRPEPLRHRWFDPWLVPVGAKFAPVIDRLKAEIDDYRRSPEGGARQRRRRPEDAIKFDAIVTAVVANLARAYVDPPETGCLATKTRNGDGRTRYDHPAFVTMFRDVLDALFALGYIERRIPDAVRGEAHSIRPLDRWTKMAAALDLSTSDFAFSDAQEPIVLVRKASRGEPTGTDHYVLRDPVNYPETPESSHMRDQMRRLNAYLASAGIAFVDDAMVPRVNPRDRFMRRRFILREGRPLPSFDEGGRLFGGFWQNLASARRANIRIQGSPVVTLDYRSMFTRLAYLEVGEHPPPGDLYLIPGLEGHRSGVKLAMNVFLFDTSLRRREWPSEMGVGVGTDDDARSDPNGLAASFKARLPEGWTVRRTRAAILALHPALAKAWGRGLGYRLMYLESEILVDVLTRLMEADVPALGLHDGLLVPNHKSDVGLAAMADAAYRRLGFALPVELKR